MPEIVTVYPASPSAVGLKHPIGGRLTEEGTPWPLDSFTCRRLADGDVVREPKAAARHPAGPAAAHAT